MAHRTDGGPFRSEYHAVERALQRILPAKSVATAPLEHAMRYVLFPGGKRIRPILSLIVCDALGGRRSDILPAACALELIHNYSLVHDDLPAMDDDDFRRGRPSCHKKFGEAMAILVGDALQALAYEVITTHTPDPSRAAALVRELATASGRRGMVEGQVLDMKAHLRRGSPSAARPAQLRQIHLKKTAALFTAACRMGAVAAGASRADLNAMTSYGRTVGLVFQIVDDILDVSSGKDLQQGKITYPAVYGLERSRRMAHATAQRATGLARRRWRKSENLNLFIDTILSHIEPI